ncbi:uncharacterized protein METZ01_LOCUS274720 [marine metagenome]|uniref:Cytochrome C Planctomycete-type domain-containing protein n=1 Tax=marine metagenome TaxID=408172 RepID=A0A382KCY0_9ZZZZ
MSSKNATRWGLLLGGSLAGWTQMAAAQDPAIDYETQIQPILTASCAVSGCHTGETLAFGGFSGAGLILFAGQSYEQLLGVASTFDKGRPLVVPGNSGESLLVQKLRGAENVGPQMPLSGDPLPPDTIQLIMDWIDQGALSEAPQAPTAVDVLSWGGIKRLTRDSVQVIRRIFRVPLE